MTPRAVVVLVTSLAVWAGTGLEARVAKEPPVAIVCLVSGESFATVQHQRTRLALFTRLRPGTLVETMAASKVVLTFFTGRRYELGPEASVMVGRTGLERTRGHVRPLVSVPAAVDIAPIAREERPGTRLAATRIRTGQAAALSISNPYPSGGAVSLHDATVVSFDPVPGYVSYRLEVEDDIGNRVFSVDTEAAAVPIPPGVLRSGASYYWRVQTRDPRKPALHAEAVFRTLSEAHATRRAALEAHARRSDDASLRLLLAEVNRVLGLRREACEALLTADGESAGSVPGAEVLARFGCSRD
jgi:hypothetical protein